MRQAVVQAFRSVRSTPLRPLQRSSPSRTIQAPFLRLPIAQRSSSSSSVRKHVPIQVSQSNSHMYVRQLSFTLFLSVAFSSFWIYQREKYPNLGFDLGLFTKNTPPHPPKSLHPTHHATSHPGLISSVSPLHPSSQTAESATQRNSIVEEGDSYLFNSAEDAAIYKQTEEQVYLMGTLTPDEATQKLRKTEESYLISRGNGVVRYDLVQVPSNNPIEDDHIEKIVSVDESVTAPLIGKENSDWMFWGVFDGHAGWTTSARLRQALVSYVARELNATYKSALNDSPLRLPTPEAIEAAMKRGFLALDHDLVHKSVEKVLSKSTKRQSTELLAPALSGSCALLSFYDSSSKLLRVACTGDSRAVLGRRGSGGKWTAMPLSEDQTGGTPSEMARLRLEHPGEDYVVHRGRILGSLEPSRAFGDASYKWSREIQEKIKRFFFGRTPNPLLKSPPYVTAEPIVTTTKVEPGDGDFIVLATDGLWEMLTNEEVIGLVGRWLENEENKSSGESWVSTFFKGKPKELPVEKPTSENGKSDTDGQRTPIRQSQYDIKVSDERFVVEDKNAATHLVRNALGGQDRDLVCALLSLISPTSRRYRDDLTVQVIFFGDAEKTGDVSINMEATSPVKAKL